MSISRRQFLGASIGSLGLSILPPIAEKRIGLAIIGLGQQGKRLLEESLNLASQYPLDILALVDTQPEVLAEYHAMQANTLITDDLDKALASTGLNAVIIATPDESHASIAAKVLAKGMDLYIEPPLGRNLAELNHLATLSPQSVLQLGYQDLQNPLYKAAARLIQTGKLGRISRVELSMLAPEWRKSPKKFLTGKQIAAERRANWAWFKEDSDGYAIGELCRVAEILRLIIGVDFPESLSAEAGNFIWQDARTNPDSFQAILRYPEGLLFSFSMGLGEERFAFYGTEGRLDLLRREIKSNHLSKIPEVYRENFVYAPSDNALKAHLNNYLAAVQYRRKALLGIEAAYRQVRLSSAILRALADNSSF